MFRISSGVDSFAGRRLGVAALVGALWLAAGEVAAVTITTSVASNYIEFVENGPIRVFAALDASVCRTRTMLDTTSAREVVVEMTVTPAPDPTCLPPANVALDPYGAGPLRIVVRAVLAGTTVAETVDDIDVLPLEGRCNADPFVPFAALVKPRQPEVFRQRLATDAAYAGLLDHPAIAAEYRLTDGTYFGLAYPPLTNPAPELARLDATGDFLSVDGNGRSCAIVPGNTFGTIVEFHHEGLDQYFYSPDAAEIAAIEAGSVGAGWTRTGRSFPVLVMPSCPFSLGTSPVYRFASVPGAPTGAHFFTRDRAECFVVDKSAQWAFEGVPFWAAPLQADGRCNARQQPLLRLWRPFGASTHRFTTAAAVVDEMVAKGWVLEGPAMCVQGT